MDSRALADTIAEPIGLVGMSYYFAPQATPRAEALGLDVIAFYAGGRGGVLGDIDATEVDETFYFFKTGLVASMVEKARATADRQQTVQAHLGAAADYAEATFGGISTEVLRRFSEAAAALTATLPGGRWPLVDGYLTLPSPTDPVHNAYYWSIVLRELRGAVHTDCVRAAGMTAAEACQLDHGGASFALHGYKDADRTEETDELVARRLAVEEETSARMAALLGALDDGQREALAQGALALEEAVATPVAVG